MNTEDAFTPEQMTAVVGALHNASMEKWIGAGLICIIGAVVIKIVMQALNRLAAKLPESIPDRCAVQFRIKNVDTEREAVYERTKGKGF